MSEKELDRMINDTYKVWVFLSRKRKHNSMYIEYVSMAAKLHHRLIKEKVKLDCDASS